MKQNARTINDARAARWARRLSVRVGEVLANHPHADPDNVRHTLILLEQPPLERLRRSLIRGRATAASKRILASKIAANRPKDRLTIPVLRDALAATQSVKRRTKSR